jgi:hypothetical protein
VRTVLIRAVVSLATGGVLAVLTWSAWVGAIAAAILFQFLIEDAT